jgi:hypothetical protein
MKKISPYCTPAMLAALTELNRRGQEVPPPLRELLRSRGWINAKTGSITPKGIDYLNGRDMIGARSDQSTKKGVSNGNP